MSDKKDAEKTPEPPKVLVIDDEAGLRDMLSYSLPQRGFAVTCAATGEEGLELATAFDFDVAVCDLMMPGIQGVEVLRRLKSARPETEVVMATGYATLETAVESMRLGAYDYIVKPYELEHLEMVLRRAAERRRLKKEVVTLEGLSRMKSEFLANMSHELRTPLNSIVGYTSLILDGTYGSVPPAQGEAMERVLAASQDLLTLINGVLDLSKLNAGMMPLHDEEFDLGELAREVADTARSLAVRKGLSLEVCAPAPLRVRADRTKTKQILVNLTGNAIKFTEKGGVTLVVAPTAGGERARVAVADTGPGISAADQEVIFEEFRQLDGSSRREHGGTGLGLAIVRKLAALMGGEVTVSSEPGRGSEFAFELPVGRVKAQSAAAAPVGDDAAAEDERPIVLAIDDDPEVHRLLRDSLSRSSYRLVGALSAEEGLALARSRRPFAITLDIMMPHRDGWSVLQTLKNDPVLRSIPVIVLSICENRSLGFSLGAADYIVKPFHKNDLIEKLESLRAAGRARLLVVDDDPSTAELFRRDLGQDGYVVEVARSGRRALERLEGEAPDAVFLSLTLPDMSGLEVLTSLQERPPWRDVPVIVLTPSGLPDAASADLERRVAMIVEKKSISLPQVFARLNERLEALGRGGVPVGGHA
ncbi:MAG: response regulator [Elusimicrobia bacterium]|nr:response regulator [Elusimicrobiota bacterium]